MAEWNEWKAKHGKTYNSPEEEENRKKVFMENKALIEEHNAKYEKGEVTYTMGLNQFSDQEQTLAIVYPQQIHDENIKGQIMIASHLMKSIVEK